MSPRVPRFQTRLLVREDSGVMACPVAPAHLPVGEGSGVTMCPTVLDPSVGVGGLWHRHVPHSSQCAMGHKQKGNTQPVYLLGWAHLPSRHARAFPRHLTSGSS
jgi:hypothetical protein